jgi:hypothetical protein
VAVGLEVDELEDQEALAAPEPLGPGGQLPRAVTAQVVEQVIAVGRDLAEPAEHDGRRDGHVDRSQHRLVSWFAVGIAGIAGFALRPRVLGLGGALAATSVVFGVLAGAVQFVGLARWPFLVPYLAETYLDPQASPAAREATGVTFQAFNQYAGGAIGEHLGYLFTAVWTLLLAAGLHRVLRRPWLAALGAVSGLGIAVGMLEPLGVEAAGLINAVAYSAWALWLVILGVLVLRGSQKHSPPAGEDT